MVRTIYCDEAGFSGNNLLDADQPYFTYAAFAAEPAAAAALVADVTRAYRIDGAELKGARLVRYNRGQKAVTAVLEACAPDLLVSAFHKRYSLATKFFEYVFEPVLADQSSLFYGVGFHRFVANVLYFEALGQNVRADAALRVFQDVARSHDPAALAALFPTRLLPAEYSAVVRDIEAFVEANHAVIARDVASRGNGEPLYRWVLDLSISAVASLLASWGQRADALTVYCDESKPLRDTREVFDMMVGRADPAVVEFEGKRQAVTFNLTAPLQFVSSATHPGIQLADVAASAFAFSLRNRTEDVSKRWLALLEDSVSEFSVLPDASRVDLDSEFGFVNRSVLHELATRSARGADLFWRMPHFIAGARARWRRHRAAF